MTSINLRPATTKDADSLLQWKNDPVMRHFSIVTHSKIKMKDHLKWLDKHINEIQIIECDGTSCGDIRVEGDEVAIKIDKRYRGMGISKVALWKIMEEYEYLIARIVDGNVPSMRLFIGRGFKVISYNTNHYLLEYKV